MKRPAASLVWLFLLSWAVPALAQTGAIEGSVVDPAGSVVPGADVSVSAVDIGLVRSFTTNGLGEFAVLGLPPGQYSIRVDHAGFRPLERTGIQLSAGRVLRLSLELQLGETSEVIVVEGEAPLVSASAADWGDRVTQADLKSLPLNGRDYFELGAIEPGVNNVRNADRGQNAGFGIQLAVNGGRPSTNSFKLDGVYINDSTNSVPVSAGGQSVGVETIQELHLVTDPYSAEYGRSSGGAFVAVSKSGSNEVHGSLYEYFRNSSLDAKNFFDAPDQPIPPLRRNQFGGVVGGPLVRDKIFYLINYEGVRGALGATARPAVPNAETRQGLLPDGEGGLRQVAVDPRVTPYLDLYPTPNGVDFGDGAAEYVTAMSQTTDEDYFSGKADYLIAPALRFSGRYTFDDATQANPDPFGLWKIVNDSQYQFVHAEFQHVASPNTIVNYRAAYSTVENAERANARSDIPLSLSFVPGQTLGSLRVSGFGDMGGSAVLGRPRAFRNKVLQLGSDAALIRGSHTLRLGAGAYRLRYDQTAVRGAIGEYRFRSIEDFLLAKTQRGEVLAPGADAERAWLNHQFFGYVQDEIRVSPSFSVSLGVRYETATVPTEANNKVASLRDPVHDAEVTVGGPAYLNPSKKNFAPRASLAWDPFGDAKTVVRVGAGLFYDLLGSRQLALAGVRMPPFFGRILVSAPEFPDLTKVYEDTIPEVAIDTLQYDMEQPRVWRWELAVQRQLARSLEAELSYAGSRGIHLMGALAAANPVVPQVQPDGRLFFPADGQRLNPALDEVGMRRPQFNSFFHGFTADLKYQPSNGLRVWANYALGKSLDEASSDVLTDFQQSDRVSTPWDYRASRGPSDFDVRHAASIAMSYAVPGSMEGPAGMLVNGWRLSSIVKAESGNPFSPWVGFDRARVDQGGGDLGQRPDLAAQSGAELILGDPQQWFDPLAFSLPEAGYYGNLGRGTLAGPGVFTLDFAAQKTVWKSERQAVEFRGEFFNLTNHPNFAVPSDLSLFNSRSGRIGSAGRITSTSTPSRQIQLALRWDF